MLGDGGADWLAAHWLFAGDDDAIAARGALAVVYELPARLVPTADPR